MSKKEDILPLFPGRLREMVQEIQMEFDQLNEIALRAGQPIIFLSGEKEYYLAEHGLTVHPKEAVRCTQQEIMSFLQYAGEYSLYAFEEEMQNGYLTVRGGHRIGICGRVVWNQRQIQTIVDVGSINVRIAHEAPGCAADIYDKLFEGDRLQNVLFVSPPGCGKTTLLRECIRLVSDGDAVHKGKRVSVIDERCEIAASYRGMPQNKVGMRTSILEACPKREGIEIVLRAMSPQVIAVDEIGSEEDAHALLHAAYSGCVLFSTAHGDSFEDIESRPGIRMLMQEEIFERIIFIRVAEDGCRQYTVYDKEREMC